MSKKKETETTPRRVTNWNKAERDPLKLIRISMMIEPVVQNLAHHCLMARALKYNRKPETFSHYVRRLIKEDYQKTKPILDSLLKDEERYRIINEKYKFLEEGVEIENEEDL